MLLLCRMLKLLLGANVHTRIELKHPCSRHDCQKLDDLHELYIFGILHENPSMYLREVCAQVTKVTGVSVSGSTVCKVLYKSGLTRKNLRKIALPRSSLHRGAFMAHVLQYSRDFFR